jgi:hypothetical protein
MAKKLAVDWDKLKSLYIKGVPLKQIADNNGVPFSALRARAHRYKWSEHATEITQILQRDVTKELQETGKEHVSEIIGLLKRAKNALRNIDVEAEPVEAIEVYAKTLDRLDQIGRRSHGLDAENNRTIHVGLIQPVVEIKLTQGVEMTKQAQVVDVQTSEPEKREIE